jgi:hypothetical protein
MRRCAFDGERPKAIGGFNDRSLAIEPHLALLYCSLLHRTLTQKGVARAVGTGALHVVELGD